ncbi:MAG: hypothetical protein AAB649_00035, partial [Patescibacteria group bacterium]
AAKRPRVEQDQRYFRRVGRRREHDQDVDNRSVDDATVLNREKSEGGGPRARTESGLSHRRIP